MPESGKNSLKCRVLQVPHFYIDFNSMHDKSLFKTRFVRLEKRVLINQIYNKAKRKHALYSGNFKLSAYEKEKENGL